MAEAGVERDVVLRLAHGRRGDVQELARLEEECETGRDLDLKPRVTLTIDPVDFLRLVTANANPTRLFLSGRLRIRGDVLLAARVPQLFAMPR